MANRSTIEWTDATWNPIGGCTRVDEGCRNCYAEIMAARFSGHGPGQWGEGLARIVRSANGSVDHRWTGQMRLNESVLDRPLRWRKPRRIFVNSTSDLFHESVPDEWIDRVFAVMALCPQHTFQVLTKRAARMREYLTRNAVNDQIMMASIPHPSLLDGTEEELCNLITGVAWPLPNVWLGTSIHDQAIADLRIPHLLASPAAVRFVSAEPLLGPVDIGAPVRFALFSGKIVPIGDGTKPLSWVIVGGESGPGARPMHIDWVRSLRDQCVSAGVAFFFKQWGEWSEGSGFSKVAKIVLNDGRVFASTIDVTDPDDRANWGRLCPTMMRKVGKARAGRLLDGREWNQMPGDAE